jgi:hypothetical protein
MNIIIIAALYITKTINIHLQNYDSLFYSFKKLVWEAFQPKRTESKNSVH